MRRILDWFSRLFEPRNFVALLGVIATAAVAVYGVKHPEQTQQLVTNIYNRIAAPAKVAETIPEKGVESVLRQSPTPLAPPSVVFTAMTSNAPELGISMDRAAQVIVDRSNKRRVHIVLRINSEANAYKVYGQNSYGSQAWGVTSINGLHCQVGYDLHGLMNYREGTRISDMQGLQIVRPSAPITFNIDANCSDTIDDGDAFFINAQIFALAADAPLDGKPVSASFSAGPVAAK